MNENNNQNITRTPATPDKQSTSKWKGFLLWLLGLPSVGLLRGLSERSWWTILASLLLFVLMILLLRACDKNQSNQSGLVRQPTPMPIVYPPYVPPVRPMEPIDPGKIGFDKDSIFPIVTDRINVLLEKKAEYTAEDFQTEFKRLYPSNDYTISYYDSVTYRLQLKVPESQRDYIMDNLNSQMPRFTFYLFDETIFSSSALPNDAGFQKGEDWFLKAVRCPEAWDITMGSDSVRVAIVDNGFDLSHPELRDHVVDAYNVIERNNHIYPPHTKDPGRGHGTHVAATAVGSANNQQGVCGVAPNCKLMPVQVATQDGLMPLTYILDGLLYAIYHGADVVNVSLGVVVPQQWQMLSPEEQFALIMMWRTNEERVWDEVFRIAHDRNVTIVLAAGNQSVLSGFDAMKRNDETIIVSAVDRSISRADFSNYGNYSNVPFCYSTVSAPGVDIYSAYPGNSYERMDGTSMAAPIVTGTVALMKSLKKDLTTSEIIDILQNTGIELQDPIGNLIQIDAALKAVQTGNYTRKQPRQNNLPTDDNKMKTHDILDDITNLYGLWKSSESLYNTVGEQVDIYMLFSPKQNQVIIVELENNNAQYKADLRVQIQNNELHITQLGEAISTSSIYYRAYNYTCTTDKDGYLSCHAKQQDGTSVVDFNLIKIK